MQFRFKPMDESYAHAIANWHYEGIYAFYDMDRDIEDLEELLDPHSWTGKYCAVVNERGELIGFFCFEKEDEAVVIGFGLRPDCTGKGLGQAFVEAGLEYAKQKFDPATFRLSVATFNRRAIRVYEKVGFKPDGVLMNETNGGQYEFLRMGRGA
jgi:ribosomal-protein-alanine N-acetyltransferase